METQVLEYALGDSFRSRGIQEPWSTLNSISREGLNLSYGNNKNWVVCFTNITDCNKIPDPFKFVCVCWTNLKILVYREPEIKVYTFENYNKLLSALKANEERFIKEGMKLQEEREYKRLFLFKDIDKHKIKEIKNANTHIKIGDFLNTSWGYDQTNVEFYVIKKILGKNYFIIQEIACKRESAGLTADNVKVSPQVYKIDIPEKAYISNDGYMSVCERGYKRGLSLTDMNKSHYETAFGYGH